MLILMGYTYIYISTNEAGAIYLWIKMRIKQGDATV